MPPNHAASTERPLKPRSIDSAAFDTSHLVVQYRGYMRLCDSGAILWLKFRRFAEPRALASDLPTIGIIYLPYRA